VAEGIAGQVGWVPLAACGMASQAVQSSSGGLQEEPVYARVVTSQIQPGKTDQWLALIRDSVVPALQEQDGFLGFATLVDREHDKTIGYSMRASDAALAASESGGHYQAQIAKLGAVLAAPPAREAYELTVLA
jgi:quinol monooxygenase YgiN